MSAESGNPSSIYARGIGMESYRVRDPFGNLINVEADEVQLVPVKRHVGPLGIVEGGLVPVLRDFESFMFRGPGVSSVPSAYAAYGPVIPLIKHVVVHGRPKEEEKEEEEKEESEWESESEGSELEGPSPEESEESEQREGEEESELERPSPEESKGEEEGGGEGNLPATTISVFKNIDEYLANQVPPVEPLSGALYSSVMTDLANDYANSQIVQIGLDGVPPTLAIALNITAPDFVEDAKYQAALLKDKELVLQRNLLEKSEKSKISRLVPEKDMTFQKSVDTYKKIVLYYLLNQDYLKAQSGDAFLVEAAKKIYEINKTASFDVLNDDMATFVVKTYGLRESKPDPMDGFLYNPKTLIDDLQKTDQEYIKTLNEAFDRVEQFVKGVAISTARTYFGYAAQ